MQNTKPTPPPFEMVCPPCYPRIYAHSEADYAIQYQAWLDSQKPSETAKDK